jgi:DNA polymerase-3 subunit epsilon
MKPNRRLLLAVAAACLFVLVVVVGTAALMLASEADASGGGRTPEERIVALVVLTLAACAVSCWVIYSLYGLYVSAPLRMAEELAATAAHRGLRLLGEYGAEELRVLVQAANQVLAVRDALEVDVAERIRQARASLEEERSRLAALMADLSQSVVVCNLDGRVLLYNQRARQELSSGTDGGNAELLGLGRSIYTVLTGH